MYNKISETQRKGRNTGARVMTSWDAVTVSTTVSGSRLVSTAVEDGLGGADEGYEESNTTPSTKAKSRKADKVRKRWKKDEEGVRTLYNHRFPTYKLNKNWY
jgi:hypothetical protein